MVTHSLHRHSESLVNTLEHVAFRMIQEVMKYQHPLLGPAPGTYQGEVPLQSRPSSSFASAAPEVPISPSCAVDSIEDAYPGRCQPRNSFNINMVELGHHPDEGMDEGSRSHSKDEEEAALCDRPRHRQNILVMIKMEADSSDRPVVSVSPALPVCGVDLTEKKDGRWRVAIDFRDLNRATPKDEYPMPVAETLINAAAGHKVLSFMDGNAGYNQIFMAPEDIHKTAFRVPGGSGSQTITTDGGSVFVSKEFRKFCDDMGIKLIRSSPYYAQANGQAEASNQSLIKLIKRKIDENPRDWHEKLSEALWAYRMSCHGAIKTSPYQLVYGQEAVLPWEITAGSRRVTFQNDLTTEEYAALMSDTIEDATELRLWSLEKIKENKARVARAYNKRVRPKEFQVGDLVWEAVLPLGTRDKAYGKWSPNWHGPYKVVQALKGNAYMLEELDGEKFPVAVNGQHLKKYFPSMWDDGQ
ncbi:hypothetical protein QYE76_050273 [Lolium multiflorum]|uniref:Integrase catalytic domain-containing protein n=1 Tax=Lolium multiflorum TaxID=4521 RepID=A0AAD8SQV9_LOLMU|nr:hypothetical protein QYE76_050273 [Lolium multiflorum]